MRCGMYRVCSLLHKEEPEPGLCALVWQSALAINTELSDFKEDISFSQVGCRAVQWGHHSVYMSKNTHLSLDSVSNCCSVMSS